MGVFATDDNQLCYIYSATSDTGKKVLGYVQSLTEKCRVIDITKDPISNTAWTEIASLVGKPLGELLSPKDIKGNSIGDTTNFDTDGWLKVIKRNPEVLQRPIVIKGNHAMQLESRSEFLTYIGVDSAGLDKTMANESPTISSQTEDETFVPQGK